MTCPRPQIALALALAALAGCGSEPGQQATADGTTTTCDLLAPAAVETLLPGAELDTGFITPGSCTYYADAGDLIVSSYAEDLTPQGPGSDSPSLQQMYDTSLSDATNNGAGEVRPAPSLGDDGQVAVNTEDNDLTAVWKRNDVVYSLQYGSWDGSADDAIRDLTTLAGQVKPPR